MYQLENFRDAQTFEIGIVKKLKMFLSILLIIVKNVRIMFTFDCKLPRLSCI